MPQRLTPLEVSLLVLDTPHTPAHVATVDVFDAGPDGLDFEALLAACGGPAEPGTSPSDAAPPSTSVAPSSTPSGAPTASPAASSPAKPGSTPTAIQPSADEVRITLTSSGGQVSPNAEKLDVPVGAKVVLSVTSDVDDEIHAHTGGDGYELEVKAGTPATGTFTVDQPGSFEIESHHLEKVFVILNVR